MLQHFFCVHFYCVSVFCCVHFYFAPALFLCAFLLCSNTVFCLHISACQHCFLLTQILDLGLKGLRKSFLGTLSRHVSCLNRTKNATERVQTRQNRPAVLSWSWGSKQAGCIILRRIQTKIQVQTGSQCNFVCVFRSLCQLGQAGVLFLRYWLWSGTCYRDR